MTSAASAALSRSLSGSSEAAPTVFCVVVGLGRVRRTEHLPPLVTHLREGFEAVLDVAMQGSPEEACEPFAQCGFEELDRDVEDRRIVGERIVLSVAPHRPLATGHLVQCDGRRIPLSVIVVVSTTHRPEERVEIIAGTGLDVPVRSIREGEVEELELPGAVLAALDTEIVRLDVTVAHSMTGELVKGVEQVVRETFQLVKGKPALAPESLTERLLARILQLQNRAPADLPQPLPSQLDDRSATDCPEHSLLSPQPAGPLLVESHLEHMLIDLDVAVLVLRRTLHKECTGRGPRTENSPHRPFGI